MHVLMGLRLEVAKDGLKTPVCCQKIQQKSKAETSCRGLAVIG